MSCLRRYWTTKQRSYGIRGVLGNYIRIRIATGWQLNTYITACASCKYILMDIYTFVREFSSSIECVITAIKIFPNVTNFAICWDHLILPSWKVVNVIIYCYDYNFINRFLDLLSTYLEFYLFKENTWNNKLFLKFFL